jgi:malate synthase
MERVPCGDLSVAAVLHEFVTAEALPGTGVDADRFWAGLADAVHTLGPRRVELLERRDELQRALDENHAAHPGAPDPAAYEAFLRSIGYLAPEPPDFTIATGRDVAVDTEVTDQAGPQLVVPLLNARFATNAANARWGSLYDALYGTDVIDEAGGRERGTPDNPAYNPVRGAAVVAWARDFLDRHLPLAGASHHDAERYAVDDSGLAVTAGGRTARLADPAAFAGHAGDPAAPESVLLVHHGLHVELQLDREHPVGREDRAGVKDVVLEAAVTTIMDLEDSVAAVDAADKVEGYRNWLRLMQGTLTADVEKGGRRFVRSLEADRTWTAPGGGTLTLPGRALLLVRNVGHLTTSDAVLDRDGAEVPEGMLDAFLTVLGGLHDPAVGRAGPGAGGNSRTGNSRTGSVYVVKPKMHGPDEVAHTCEVFDRVEDTLGLPRNTVKIGIMDEERRTSVNLKACVHAARERVVFVNTGFLDRTGDEIHTSMRGGPVVRKGDMRDQPWIHAYEEANVDVALACGFAGRAQIGKGMWAAPDNLAEMLAQKGGHPRAGASCAWVPSPTAATLHAVHYHETDVAARQRELDDARRQLLVSPPPTPTSRLADLLTIPFGDPASWSADERRAELDTNVQSTLGYVVRWIDHGVGCSKVPDLRGVALMEDRATCRISSQHVSNWVMHGVVTVAEVEDSLRRMAVVVDRQNAGDPDYLPMAPGFDGQAFLAARELLLEGAAQPSGYTEPVLHRRRRLRKGELTGGAPVPATGTPSTSG